MYHTEQYFSMSSIFTNPFAPSTYLQTQLLKGAG